MKLWVVLIPHPCLILPSEATSLPRIWPKQYYSGCIFVLLSVRHSYRYRCGLNGTKLQNERQDFILKTKRQ
jgi:hypothetical protein